MERGDDRFTAAFDSYSAQVLAFALRRVGSREDAEDVAAETFAVAWRRRGSIPGSPLPWLYAIAANVIRNNRRSTRRLGRLRSKLAGERTAEGANLADLVTENDAFATAFAELSEGQREILRLAAWEGLDTCEGAVALDCSEAAFKVRLHRARRELEKRMSAAGHEGDEMPKPTLRSEVKEK